MGAGAVSLFIFTGFTWVLSDVNNETQSTSEDLQQLAPKLQQLTALQKQIFGVKLTTKEDTDMQQSVFDIFPFLAEDSGDAPPEQLPYLFEGDIILTPEQINEILQNAQNTLAAKLKTKFRPKRSVTSNLNLRWTSLPIPYYVNLDTGVDEKAVLHGIAEWESDTCLTFSRLMTLPQTNALEFIRGSGCYSYIGKSGNRPQQVSIGTGCTGLGTVTHEIGHALGLYHEQSRYDRNDYIRVLVQNIQSSYLGQFTRQGIRMMIDYGVGYDYGSVMHYDQSSFNKRGKKTIETLDDDYQQTIGQRAKPSFADIKRINFAYCNASCTQQLGCLNGGYTDPKNCTQCRCPDGWGDILCDQIQPSVDDCGPNNFSSTEDYQVIKMVGKKNCYYIVKFRAPEGNSVYFQLGNLTFKNHNPCTVEYLEVKYRSNFVQSGARYCKHYPVTSVSESNILILIYKGSDTSSVNLRFKTGPPVKQFTFAQEGYAAYPDYYEEYYSTGMQTECTSWTTCTAPCGGCGQTTRSCNSKQEVRSCNPQLCNNLYCCPPATNINNLCVVPGLSNSDYSDYYYY